MEAKAEEKKENKEAVVTIQSKKIQINSIEHDLANDLVSKAKEPDNIIAIKIEGNSYSLQFSESFGKILGKCKNIKDLNINDMFVGRLKD